MANFNTSLKVILKNEGGYNCAFTGSGETYKGIDRNYSQDWAGWKIIDAAKKSGKLSTSCKGEPILKDSQLDALVNGWYSQQLLPYFGNNFGTINNQYLANFIADFMWHKPYRTLPIANAIIKNIQPTAAINDNFLTADSIKVINNNSSLFYTTLYNKRLQYYKNPKSMNSSWNEKFIKSLQGLLTRVTRFPSQLYWWTWL